MTLSSPRPDGRTIPPEDRVREIVEPDPADLALAIAEVVSAHTALQTARARLVVALRGHAASVVRDSAGQSSSMDTPSPRAMARAKGRDG